MTNSDIFTYKCEVYKDRINHPVSKAREFFKGFIFAFLMTFLFFCMALSTGDPAFLEHGYTGASDDFTYLTNVSNALLLNNPSYFELSQALSQQTEHSPAYPVILYLFSMVAPLGIFLAVFLNFYAVYYIGYLSISRLGFEWSALSLLKFILLTPGIIFVACHAYKDIFLLLIMMLIIKAFKDKNYLLGLCLVFLSSYFRPYNWIIVFLAYMLFTEFRATILMVIAFLVSAYFVLPQYIMEQISLAIQAAHITAYRDIESYGSLYQPSGNYIFDYLLGIARFVLLPIPWSVAWEGRPFFLSALEFLQSIIIWLTLILVSIKPGVTWKVLRSHGVVFWYCFLQASTYSVLYFGNAQPRYRVYLYLLCFFIIASMMNRLKNPIRGIRG